MRYRDHQPDIFEQDTIRFWFLFHGPLCFNVVDQHHPDVKNIAPIPHVQWRSDFTNDNSSASFKHRVYFEVSSEFNTESLIASMLKH